MPRRNRVDPFGDLHAVAARGRFTGNRGCLVDDDGDVVHHRGRLWITCRLEFRGWRQPLAAARHWTPLFFLDEAVALAAGHRPCACCRRDAYRAYRDAIDPALRAAALDARLSAAGSGRATAARLVLGRQTLAFTFAGWHDARRQHGTVDVLTPPTSVTALRNGFEPVLHDSARIVG